MKSMLVVAGIATALTLGSAVNAGTGKKLVGQEAPAINVQSWLNGDGRTEVADYRGEVVLLEFWKTH